MSHSERAQRAAARNDVWAEIHWRSQIAAERAYETERRKLVAELRPPTKETPE